MIISTVGGTGGSATSNSFIVGVSDYSSTSITYSNGSYSRTVTIDTQKPYIYLPYPGTWTFTCGTDSSTVTWEPNETISFIPIFGISRSTSSNALTWTRTDKAVGLTATASIGTSGYSSSFDTVTGPWKGMARETLSTGDIMVKIPKFYFKRAVTDGTETIQISNGAKTGFSVHPAFTHNGTTQDYIYVGAYETSGTASKSGVAPQVNITRDAFRTNARGKNASSAGNYGWGIIDISTISAIQMLYLVEFANNSSQATIGAGNSNTSAAISTGGCDSLWTAGCKSGTAGSSRDASGSAVLYRGIENFWGNVWEFSDGLNWNGGTYYVCNNQANYADNTATNYTQLSYTGSTSWSGSFITSIGYDSNNSYVLMPSAAGSGSATTYYSDAVWSNSGWRVFRRGGSWDLGTSAGLFASFVYGDSSDTNTDHGSRLLYIPS